MNVYQIVNDVILKQMEKGIVPWKKCWTGNDRFRNPISDHDYRGVNILLCMAHNEEYGLSSPHFVTKKQLIQAGYFIKAGAKQSIVTYSERLPKKDNPEDYYWIFKYYPVYNIEHTTLPADYFPVPEPIQVPDFDFQYGYIDGPKIEFGNFPSPLYSGANDRVGLPPAETFHSVGLLQGALFHELVHSTKKEGRTERSLSYAKEELVAEMGSAFLMNIMGYDWDIVDTSSYLQTWMGRIKEDQTLLTVASGKAQQAVEFIMNKGPIKYKMAM